VVEYPAECFTWDWAKTHGDRILHENNRGPKVLSRWFSTDPHLDESKNLVDQASLLGICLGVGILMKDARCTLFTAEDEYPEGTPDFIIDSFWTVPVYEMLRAYIKKLHQCLVDHGEGKGYVNQSDLLEI
jgi:hypothetical protein